MGGDLELVAGAALDFVGVAIAAGFGDDEAAGRGQVVERSAIAVEGDVAAFGLGDLEEVHAHAGETDGLGGGGALIGDGHLPEVILVHAEKDGGGYEDDGQYAHEQSVICQSASRNGRARRCAKSDNWRSF